VLFRFRDDGLAERLKKNIFVGHTSREDQEGMREMRTL
jgi:N-dimethylarginine dimethylaminohydrolase